MYRTIYKMIYKIIYKLMYKMINIKMLENKYLTLLIINKLNKFSHFSQIQKWNNKYKNYQIL